MKITDQQAREGLATTWGLLRTFVERCEDDPAIRLTIATPIGGEMPLRDPLERVQRIAAAVESLRYFPTRVPRERFYSMCVGAVGALLITEPERFPHLVRFVRGEPVTQ